MYHILTVILFLNSSMLDLLRQYWTEIIGDLFDVVPVRALRKRYYPIRDVHLYNYKNDRFFPMVGPQFRTVRVPTGNRWERSAGELVDSRRQLQDFLVIVENNEKSGRYTKKIDYLVATSVRRYTIRAGHVIAQVERGPRDCPA